MVERVFICCFTPQMIAMTGTGLMEKQTVENSGSHPYLLGFVPAEGWSPAGAGS